MGERDTRHYNRPQRQDDRRSHSDRPRNDSPRRQGNRSFSHPRVFIRNGTELFLLDILQHGGVDKAGHSWHPICQVIEVPSLQLYEVALNKQTMQDLILQQKITYSSSESCPLGKPNRILKYDELTPTSQNSLETVLEVFVAENENHFVQFINLAGPITIKRHSLEILPGVGKKMMWEIVNLREKEPFKSYEDIHARVHGFKPVEVIAKRIIEELSDPDQKRYLFVKQHKKSPDRDAPRGMDRPSVRAPPPKTQPRRF